MKTKVQIENPTDEIPFASWANTCPHDTWSDVDVYYPDSDRQENVSITHSFAHRVNAANMGATVRGRTSGGMLAVKIRDRRF